MEKKLIYGNEAKTGLQKGTEKLAKAVSTTLGAKGRNVLIEDPMFGTMPRITKDGVAVAKAVELSDPLEAQGARLLKQVALDTNKKVGDGCQPLYSKIMTPKGFTYVKDIKAGDIICTANASYQVVVQTFDKGMKSIYEVTLIDGRKVRCTGGHLWEVYNWKGKRLLFSTKELTKYKDFCKRNNNGVYKYGLYVPTAKVQYVNNPKFQPLTPELIGILCTTTYKNEQFVIHAPKGQEQKIKEIKDENGFSKGVFIKDIQGLISNNNTFNIPLSYLYSSIEVRERVLAGILLTQKTRKKKRFTIVIENKTLTAQIVTLCRSLGISVTVTMTDDAMFVIKEQKRYKYGLPVISVKPLHRKELVRCIKVSNYNNLYVTDDYIVTHNTTTSIVLAQDIIHNGLEKIKEGANPILIKRGINEATTEVLNELKKNTRLVKDNKEAIKGIATTSVNNDTELGALIGETFHKIGQYGIVKVQESKKGKNYVEYMQGLKFDVGFFSTYFLEMGKLKNEINKPKILVTNHTIKSLLQFNNPKTKTNLLATCFDKKVPLIIFCEDIAKEAEQTIVVQRISPDKETPEIYFIKTPDFGKDRLHVLEDIAVAVGGTFLDTEKGMKLEDATEEHLGECEQAIVSMEETIIVKGAGTKEAIEQRLQDIDAQLKLETNESESLKLRIRKAKLSNGMATIYLTADSDVEYKELYDRVEDAINATQAALEEGVIIGGGVTLFEISDDYYNKTHHSKLHKDVIQGKNIVYNAIQRPFLTILDNAGENANQIIKVLKKQKTIIPSIGYNVQNNNFIDMEEEGILDPVKVTKVALTNASSVASTMLTTECVIINDEIDN